MIRITSLITALLLGGCMSTPAPVDIRGCCYPGAQIALARMPSSGDVAISLGAIEHVLVSRTDPTEREAVTPRLSSDQAASDSRTTFTPTNPEATPHATNARRPATDLAQLPAAASWVDFAGATHSSHATHLDACPTSVAVDTGSQ